ncbi:hypothetical protein NBRC110019_22500 [Neptunitalea chrysea]|uniref:Uncharacterized protein n=1 Tax=Neptunitalea chrysea TaxID=1647581 RepID=A0A9W6EU95_9FLAO|nr:hypothetical protein [Neptunitalea chrysea]GLB53210.1 hypothetical protein NBRC110019_22500 [Neptunitalea chrysea]
MLKQSSQFTIKNIPTENNLNITIQKTESRLANGIAISITNGSSFFDVLPKLLSILGFAIVLNIWAIINYKKKR